MDVPVYHRQPDRYGTAKRPAPVQALFSPGMAFRLDRIQVWEGALQDYRISGEGCGWIDRCGWCEWCRWCEWREWCGQPAGSLVENGRRTGRGRVRAADRRWP